MMKQLLWTVCLLVSTYCMGQSKVEQKQPHEAAKCMEVSLDHFAPKDSLVTLPFSKIIIHDVRSDTSKFGYHRKPQGPVKFCFQNGAIAQLDGFIQAYLSTNLDRGKEKHVVMYLRKMWVTYRDSVERVHDMNLSDAFVRVHFKADFFIQGNEGYSPLLRFDTVVLYKGKFKKHTANIIEDPILLALDKLKQVNYTQVFASRQYALADINRHYEQLLQAPVLNAVHVAKGVYESFEDFRQNKPSDTAFRLKLEPIADLLYVKDKHGNEQVKRNVWAISDGDHLYIRYGNNFFPLYRQGKTWEFYGMEFRPRPKPSSSGNSIAYQMGAGLYDVMAEKYKGSRLKAYQVDAETGIPY